ncbi:f5a65b85-6825-44c0-8c95-cc2709ff95ec [Sclerotinia trifoliorum]|uniref:F5a65b85-6825-44c0-8c95-cc2709ff95ec n=1 Tax=Sclerotinia trifoliorum TaxID=28548 RepID=A0A8H2ZSH4_9HELO|nr:f5a65b85-6825-44c0-8c95-cc2709ff95ec [Sclerotinia trifoliorum]
MQQPPAWVIASWPTPNYIDPETHGYGNVILNIVLYIILCCFIALRIWTRTRLRASFGADDIMILFAMIPTTGFFVLSLLADLKFMWTRHQYDIPSSHVEFGLKMVMLIEIMFASACTLTKLSMLMLVRRMLTSASMFWRRVTLGAICVVGLQGGLFCIVLVFQCRPPQDYWKVTKDPQPNCIDQSSTLLLAGIVNTLTDFLVVLLPIRTVYSTNLPRRQSLIVSFLFTLGFLSCFAGIIRTYYMYKVTKVWDQVWASYPVWVTAAVELYIGIICTSIPATKAFFVTYIPKLFSSHPSCSSGASHSPRTYTPRYNSKGENLASPRFGITSTSKSPKVLHSQNSKTPLSTDNSLYDRTIGTSIFELSSFTSTTSSNRAKGTMDEELGNAPFAVLEEDENDTANSNSNMHTNNPTLSRGIIGSLRRNRERGRERENPNQNSNPHAPNTQESRRQKEKEKEGGWDFHIDVVRTVEVEEEHIDDEKRI